MGFGDEIMASAEARTLKRLHPDARVVVGDGREEFWSVVFDGNPHLTRLHDVRPGERIVWLRNHYGRRPYLDYERGIPGVRQAYRPYRATPGDLFLSADEEERARAFVEVVRVAKRPVVYIEPNVAFGPTKDWGFDRWQQVVDRLKGHVVWIQPEYGQPILRGVRAPPTTFRDACALIAESALHVGPEGALHHAAAALGRPAVVLFGGRISPSMTGYGFHRNLYVDLPRSPCGMIAPCEHCRRCFDRISVDAVVEAIVGQLACGRKPPRPMSQPGRVAEFA